MGWVKVGNNRGQRGRRGAQGLGGAASLPTDDAIAGMLGTEGTSKSKTVMDAALIRTSGDTLAESSTLGNKLTKAGVIIGHGAAGSFDAEMTESLTTIYDVATGRFFGVYTGYGTNTGVLRGSIGRAWSEDGVLWHKSGVLLSASHIPGAPDEHGCTGPTLVFADGEYHLFYIGLTAPGYEGGSKTVCRASSPSLSDPVWTRHGTVMSPTGNPGGGDWMRAGIWHPSFIQVGGIWYCFINASAADGHERIGFATAPSIEGPWTFSALPVIDTTPGTQIAGDPSMTRVIGGYRMDFFRAGGPIGAADFFATTTEENFPWGWVMGNGGEPILEPGDSFDGLYAHKPHILKTGGRVLHYYTAVSNFDERTIALAVDPDPWRYQTIMTTESDVARTTSGTGWVTAAKSTAFFDPRGRLNLQLRILVRAASGATNTIEVRDSTTLTQASIASGTAWANAASPWKTVNRQNIFATHCDFRSSDAGAVTLGSIAYEFRWLHA